MMGCSNSKHSKPEASGNESIYAIFRLLSRREPRFKDGDFVHEDPLFDDVVDVKV